jgi:hypothetical protein
MSISYLKLKDYLKAEERFNQTIAQISSNQNLKVIFTYIIASEYEKEEFYK